MKPYLLIVGDNYYPSAYTGDWVACYDDCLKDIDGIIDELELL